MQEKGIIKIVETLPMVVKAENDESLTSEVLSFKK
jgi:hypothetical protein